MTFFPELSSIAKCSCPHMYGKKIGRWIIYYFKGTGAPSKLPSMYDTLAAYKFPVIENVPKLMSIDEIICSHPYTKDIGDYDVS